MQIVLAESFEVRQGWISPILMLGANRRLGEDGVALVRRQFTNFTGIPVIVDFGRLRNHRGSMSRLSPL
jgi:hypothetical protein